MRLAYRALDALLARGALPDVLLRAGSRAGVALRLGREQRGGIGAQEERLHTLLERMRSGPIALATASANEQHYELPPEFFELILGPRRKYSGCVWTAGARSLAEAEEATLALYHERAQLADGLRILDLGCGWGSLSLWLAERLPAARITAVSNSSAQRATIERERARLGLGNLEVIRADVNTFEPAGRFDRVVSIEMFEHARNWAELLRRICGWLADDGRLFVQVFSHRTLAYAFEGTWAAERFFTGGLMPSHDLIARFQDDMALERSWAIPGTHYARTLRAWLERLDDNAAALERVLIDAGASRREARATLGRWRLFLISTAEMWASGRGGRWMISHYRLAPRDRVSPARRAVAVPARAGRRGGRGQNDEVLRTYSA
ncbi:MAG TPA: class I SAM-dependent methyltransferase [Solirubrobacteraceae bacterium]|nr:class I SAM-dependent methyltransferase [Solirubrobacteraceae bacterium]